MSLPETPGSASTAASHAAARPVPAVPIPPSVLPAGPVAGTVAAGGPPDDPHDPRSFTALLRIREFRALWFADGVSVLGDQIMRVCVSFLVYTQTGNEVATAVIYALTFLPTLFGGLFLSGLADRFPRKTVMIVTDVARAALFGLAALPGLPIWVIATMLVIGVMLGSAFRSAQTATLPDVLTGERYTTGLAFRSISLQSAQLLGYGVGGVVAGTLGPRWGLVLDAATFVISAVLLALHVQKRPVPARERTHTAHWKDYGHGIVVGLGLVVGSPQLRILVGLALMSGFYVVPEGLAAPYAAQFGGGGVATGLLMAAEPAGSALGAWLLVKFVPQAFQRRWMAVAAAVPGFVLTLCWLGPGFGLSLTIWAVAGVVSVFQIPASVEFVRLVPDNQRGVALGLVTSGMLTAQGLGVVAGGLVAGASSAVVAIGATGAAGVLAGAVLAVRWAATGSGEPAGRAARGGVGSVG